MAEVGYMSVAPHNPIGPGPPLRGGVPLAQNAHLAASIPIFLILEMIGAPEHLAACAETLKAPLVIEDGYLHVPTGPGLGVEPDLEAVARHPGALPRAVVMGFWSSILLAPRRCRSPN